MTVHARLAISALSSFGWSFDQDLALWRDLRLHHAGLWARKLDPGRPAKIAELQAAGIRSSTVVSGTFDLGAPDTWPRSHDAIRASVSTAADTDGTSVYITPGRADGRRWDELFAAFAEAVAPSVADAADHGVRLSIEPSVRCDVSFVNTLHDAIDVAEATGVGIVVDFGNCWMERDLARVIGRAAPHIGLVQLCDIRLGPDAPSAGSRVLPGDGQLPLARMIGDVLDAGYTGLFDLEVVGAEVEREGYESTLRRGVDVVSGFLESLGL
jgi:sugar phosphate isomerase/epimerase